MTGLLDKEKLVEWLNTEIDRIKTERKHVCGAVALYAARQRITKGMFDAEVKE